jgi:hypothetical protein
MKRLLIIAVLVTSSRAMAANELWLTGADVYFQVQSAEQKTADGMVTYPGIAVDKVVAERYFKAFVSGVTVALNVETQQVCLPEGTRANQAHHTIAKFIADNPQRRHEHEYDLTGEALAKAWPCAVDWTVGVTGSPNRP